jgi:hypothetical protein
VGSEWGIDDRYHMKAAEFASLIGGEIIWQGRIATMAGREPMMWYVILPDRVGASKPGGSHS